MSVGKCRSCGASVFWTRTLSGKSMPLDLAPHEDGNVVVTAAGARVLSDEALALACPKLRRYLCHFATCKKGK